MAGLDNDEKRLAKYCAVALAVLAMSLLCYRAVRAHQQEVALQEREERFRSEQEVFAQGEVVSIESGGSSNYLTIEGSFDVRVTSCMADLSAPDLLATLAARGEELADYGVQDELATDARYVLVDVEINNKDASDPHPIDPYALVEDAARAQMFILHFDSETAYDYGRSELLCGVSPGVPERVDNHAFYWDVFLLPAGEKTQITLLYEIPSSCGEVDWQGLAVGIGGSPDQDREKARWLIELDPVLADETLQKAEGGDND